MEIPKKIFVCYKYSDIVDGREDSFNFRDDLVSRLGERGFIHKGENSESEDMIGLNEGQIINKIAPYIKKSSITVLLLSPNVKASNWIPWEISLSLRERAYDLEQNKTRNGIIGVYVPIGLNGEPDKNGNYSYYLYKKNCGTTYYVRELLPEIVIDNAFNLKNGEFECSYGCCKKVYSSSEGSYIELVKWHDFVSNMEHYIENAWKRRNNFEDYDCRINLVNGR